MKLLQILVYSALCYPIIASKKQEESFLIKGWKHPLNFEHNYQLTQDQKILPKKLEKEFKSKKNPYEHINYNFENDPDPEDFIEKFNTKNLLQLSQSTASTHSSSENSKE